MAIPADARWGVHMTRNPFGWDYPAGAENDPNAPWNQTDNEDCSCDSAVKEWNPKVKEWFCASCGGTLAEELVGKEEADR